LYTEIQRRTIHTILSKPLQRWEFVVGKYAGMAFTLLLLVALFSVTMTGVLWLQDAPLSVGILKAMLLTLMEVWLVAGIAVFFSSFSSPVLSGLFSFFLWFLGRISPQIRATVATADDLWTGWIAGAALHVLPDMHVFGVSGGMVDGEYVSIHSDFVDWSYVAYAIGYGLLYLVALLILAAVFCSRRDFS